MKANELKKFLDTLSDKQLNELTLAVYENHFDHAAIVDGVSVTDNKELVFDIWFV